MTDESKQQQTMKTIHRKQLKDQMRQVFEQTLDARVDRYLEINHQGIIGNHYFAAVSSECIDLYRDGHFISAVIASQAVNEGIVKFLAGRNGLKEKKEHSQLIAELFAKKAISVQCKHASERIWNSFRNDVHHMNQKIATIPFQTLAKRNLQDLSAIEIEIFGTYFQDGKLVPFHPKYWDVKSDGTVEAFLRLE